MHKKTSLFFGLSVFLLSGMVFYLFSNTAEKSIVVIIPSYNNEKWIDTNGQWVGNLPSVLNQEYTNYEIIFINDFSKDKTREIGKKIISEYKQEHRVKWIKNTQRRGALANLYNAIHSCADHKIIVLLDGDDAFKHNNVLNVINKAYDDPNVWLTYGQYEEYPQGKIGHCSQLPEQVIKRNAYRRYYWLTSHLRTFKAGLFKKIEKKDLKYNGDFFQVTWDMAILLPMLEMAAGRIKFIPEVLYVYNMATPINDYKVRLPLVLKCEQVIRGMKPYAPLDRIA